MAATDLFDIVMSFSVGKYPVLDFWVLGQFFYPEELYSFSKCLHYTHTVQTVLFSNMLCFGLAGWHSLTGWDALSWHSELLMYVLVQLLFSENVYLAAPF